MLLAHAIYWLAHATFPMVAMAIHMLMALFFTTFISPGVPTQRGSLVDKSGDTRTSKKRSGLVCCYSRDGRHMRLCERAKLKPQGMLSQLTANSKVAVFNNCMYETSGRS